MREAAHGRSVRRPCNLCHGRASILIPSPNVAENHQYYNALELEKAGAAVVVEEKDLTGEKLIELVDRLTSRPETLAEMGQKARALARPDSLDLIWDRLCQLVPALQGKH